MVIDYRGSEKRKREPLLILCDLHVHATLNRDQLVSYQTTAVDGLHHRYADSRSGDYCQNPGQWVVPMLHEFQYYNLIAGMHRIVCMKVTC